VNATKQVFSAPGTVDAWTVKTLKEVMNEKLQFKGSMQTEITLNKELI
jgi:hypothetical protein